MIILIYFKTWQYYLTYLVTLFREQTNRLVKQVQALDLNNVDTKQIIRPKWLNFWFELNKKAIWHWKLNRLIDKSLNPCYQNRFISHKLKKTISSNLILLIEWRMMSVKNTHSKRCCHFFQCFQYLSSCSTSGSRTSKWIVQRLGFHFLAYWKWWWLNTKKKKKNLFLFEIHSSMIKFPDMKKK